MARKEAALMWRPIPGLRDAEREAPSSRIALFASVSNAGAASAVIEWEKEAFPSADQLLRLPLALLAPEPSPGPLPSPSLRPSTASSCSCRPMDCVLLKELKRRHFASLML